VGADKPELAVLDPGVGVLQRRLAKSEGLDLGAFEGDAALEDFENVVVVPSAAVARHVAN
jgi:hypothetical protein